MGWSLARDCWNHESCTNKAGLPGRCVLSAKHLSLRLSGATRNSRVRCTCSTGGTMTRRRAELLCFYGFRVLWLAPGWHVACSLQTAGRPAVRPLRSASAPLATNGNGMNDHDDTVLLSSQKASGIIPCPRQQPQFLSPARFVLAAAILPPRCLRAIRSDATEYCFSCRYRPT